MKIQILFIFFLSYSVSFSQEIEIIDVPERVVYNYSSNSVIEKVKKSIQTSLSDTTNYNIITDRLIIGPRLWNRYKKNTQINKIEKGKVILHVDENELEAKMSQNNIDSKIIWNEFRKELNQEKYIIRKATKEELDYHWTLISWDIDEPLLIIETQSKRYILDFIKDDLQLFWLEELPSTSNYINPIDNKKYYTNFKTYQNGKEINKLTIGNKETNLETIVLLNSEKEFEENSSIEDLKIIVDKTSAIFNPLFKDSEKSGRIMIQFELKKVNNEIQFATKNNIDLDIMKEFKTKINNTKFPNSKNQAVKLQLVYKVNSYNEVE